MATPVVTQDEFGWLDVLPQVEKEALAGLAKVNFGQLSMAPRYVQWVKPPEITDEVWKQFSRREQRVRLKPIEVTLEEWLKLNEDYRSQEAVLTVNIQEFNPKLEFTYERRVQIGGRDWRKTFKPSVEKVFGPASMSEENMSATLRKLAGAYVETNDVPQQPKRGQDASEVEFNTIKLVCVFESREKCHAACVERFGDQSGAATPDNVPGWDETLRTLGWTPEAWAGQLSAMKATFDGMSGMPDIPRCAKIASDYGVPVECVKQALASVASVTQGNVPEAELSIPF